MLETLERIELEAQLPDARGHFGIFGGKFVSETLMPALEELDEACNAT